MSRAAGQMGNGPRRQPFSAVNNRQDVPAAADASSTEVSESASVEFTKEEVEVLLNEKLKLTKFDLKVLSFSLIFIKPLIG